jgi:hypothetical protein
VPAARAGGGTRAGAPCPIGGTSHVARPLLFGAVHAEQTLALAEFAALELALRFHEGTASATEVARAARRAGALRAREREASRGRPARAWASLGLAAGH